MIKLTPEYLYENAKRLFAEGERNTIIEDVQREVYVRDLLKDYSPDYVVSCFEIPQSEVDEIFKHFDPVAERQYELDQMVGIADLMSRIVGAENLDNH